MSLDARSAIFVMLLFTLLMPNAIPMCSASTRPSDYPDIMEFIDNNTKQATYIFDIMNITVTSIRTRSNVNDIYDNMLGLMYWSMLKSNQQLAMATNESESRPNTTDLFNETAESLPDILGPPNGTSGLAYLLNHSVRSNRTLMKERLNQTLGVLDNAIPMVGGLMSRLSEVFGWADQSIW